MDLADYLSIYENAGISIIPANYLDKTPYLGLEWGEFQKRAPTQEEKQKWFRHNPEPKNIAVLCGEPSNNLVVLDFDDETTIHKFFDMEKLKQGTWVVKTPHGYHVYYRTPEAIDSIRIPNVVEVRSNGEYVIAPPSKLKERTGEVTGYNFISRHPEIPFIPNLKNSLFRRAKELGYDVTFSYDDTRWLQPRVGYKGSDPPCITTLISTTAPKGERDERALRIACYYANFRDDLQLARDKLVRWYPNVEQSLSDPFTLEDALDKITSARRGTYVFGCNDFVLKQYCQPCPLGEAAFVNQILESPDMLEKIKLLLDEIIAGEEYNKQTIFILSLSGKIRDWEKKQIILLQGEAGGGKTTLANTISSLYKTKKVGRFTRHALDYSDLEKGNYEILYLQELGKTDEEEQGVSTLKFLSRDDKGYKVEITIKNPDEPGFTTIEKTIPPITVITTTTRVDIDDQLYRRAWPINVDETEKQTKRVRKLKIKHAYEKNLQLFGVQKELSQEKAKRLLEKIIHKLDFYDVIIPFPKALFDILNIKTLRVRGDYDKLYDFVWFVTFLLQRQMPMIKCNDKEILVASPTKVAHALTILEEPLITMLTGLEKRFRDLFVVMKELGFSRGTVITLEEREQIANALGKTPDTIYKRLKTLARKSILVTEKTEHRQKHYILNADLGTIERDFHQEIVKLKSPSSLALDFIKEAKSWVTSNSDLISEGVPNLGFVKDILKIIETEEEALISQNKEGEFGKTVLPTLEGDRKHG